MSDKHWIVKGDNETVLKTDERFRKDQFNACITDPPYGMDMAEWDRQVPPVSVWKEVIRVLKPGGFVVSFCAPEFYHRMAVNIEDAGFRTLGAISWIITTKMAKKNRLKPAQEFIYVGQKPLDGSIENNWSKWDCGKIDIDGNRIPWEKEPPKGWRKHGHTRRGFGGDVEKAKNQKVETVDANPAGRYPSDIIGWFDDPEIQKYFYAPRVTRKERGETNDHPTPKPILLMRFLCRIFGGPKESLILDPFLGSGSTGIAALQEGYHFAGIELFEKYCQISEQRIHEHCSEAAEPLFETATVNKKARVDFSTALQILKRGGKVARAGWNGKDMFLFLVPGSTFEVNRPPLLGIYVTGTKIDYHAHIDMKTAQGYIVPWLASQTDLLSEDWEEVIDAHTLSKDDLPRGHEA